MKRVTAVLMIALVLFTGCKKGDKGDTGPAGINGTNGIDGNANVKASTYSLNASNWGFDGANKVSYANLINNNITSDIVSTGTVSVFVTGTSGQWIALPWTYWDSPSITYNYGYSLGQVTMQNQKTDGSYFAPIISAKVVVISASQKAAHPKTNWKDYNEVMAVTQEKSSISQ
jgi:hypothetical protein